MDARTPSSAEDRAPARLPAEPDGLLAGGLAVAARLRERGFVALFAGGCVRDLVLGRAPKDYDVATDAKPEDVIAAFEKSIPVGAAFGVVRVVVAGHEYEVATFRVDGHYGDGRRPTGVVWADARADAERRDFTVNGMFFDPVTAEIIDYVGGRADLERRVIRAIGDANARFSEDYLRLMRCVRFAARLEFTIDAATWQATIALAPNITRVSNERIKDELDRMLGDRHRGSALELLQVSGILEVVLPEVVTVEAMLARLRRLPADASLNAAWAAVAFDVLRALLELTLVRLRASRDFQRTLLETIDGAGRLRTWDALPLAQQKRLARRATFADALTVAESAAIDTAAARAIRWDPNDLRPTPLLSGDVLQAHGFKPGPRFKAALEAVEDAQLEGRVTTLDQALAIARDVIAAP